MEIIFPGFLTGQVILFITTALYITLKLDPKWKFIFGFSFSVVSFLIDQSKYLPLIYPYSFDFYWKYFLFFVYVILSLKYLITRGSNKNEYVRNPYMIKISHTTKFYYVQYGLYTFKDTVHSSHDNFEPMRLREDGSFELSDSSSQLGSKLFSPIKKALNLGNVTVSLAKIPSKDSIHHRFVLLAYNKSESSSDFRSLDRLHISESRFSRLQLNSFPNRFIRKLISIDGSGNLVFNTNEITQIPDIHLEIGTYEFELLQHLISKYNNRKLEIPYTYGNYYLGLDLRHHPVFIDEPDNLLYIGSSDFLPQILNFDFINRGLIITDNQKLISQLSKTNPEEIIIESIQNIRINLIEFGLKHPKFLELLFDQWAKLLPDDNKAEYSQSFVSLISQFVELKYLLDGEDTVSKLMTRDLLVSKTYKEYNVDISVDVLTKFKGLLDLPVFNGFKQEAVVKGDEIHHFADFLTMDPRVIDEGDETNEIRYRVLDISGFSERQKQALFILFCVMKEQALIPFNWLAFSVNGSHKLNENILKHLAYYQNFRQILLHVEEIGNDLSWIQKFDCKVHDKHLNHQQMRKYLKMEKNYVTDGLFIHLSFGRKTILQTQNDKEE